MLLVVGTPVDSSPETLSELYPNESGSILGTHFFMINRLLANALTVKPLKKVLSESKSLKS